MEHPEDEFDDPETSAAEEDCGEDHRGDEPGYDLDEQRAIEELERERAEEQ